MISRAEMARQMAMARELNRLDIEFVKAHPHDRATGERMAKKYLEQATNVAEWMDKNWNKSGKTDPMPEWDGDAIIFEVEPFFTEEQKIQYDAICARQQHVEIIGKAQMYDDIIGALERAGLVPDMALNESGNEDIIAIENSELANKWFKEAYRHDENEE